MWRSPVCEKEHLQGLVCDDCGFDLSCDYEQNRTLCSALPKRIEPISVRTATWKQRRKQMVAVSPGKVACPKCGGKQFFFLVDELQFMCADCEAKLSIAFQMDGSVPESDKVSDAPSVTWTLSDTGVLTISGSGEMNDFGYEALPWKEHKTEIASVMVKPGVRKIGAWAFYECSGLTSITLPESVTEIGSYAFNGCTSLTSIILPEGITKIGWGVFGFYTSLTSVTLPKSVTQIGSGAFQYCSSLTDIYYGGTEEQWRSIEIDQNNNYLLNATIHFR